MSILTNEALHEKTPQEITSLLYEACYDNLEQASKQMDDQNYIDVNFHLQKALDILHRLGAGINYEAGIIADQLEQVYNYMADTIVEANYTKDKEKINETLTILSSIMTAWNEALKKNENTQPNNVKMKTQMYDDLSMYE